MKKFLLTLFLAVTMLMPAALVQAEVIYDWNYATTASLTNMQWSESVFPTAPLPQAIGGEVNGGYLEYRWGQFTGAEINQNSGLGVGGHSGAIKAGDSSVPGITITHFNNPIVMGISTLESGTISASVTLSAGGGVSYTVNSSLSFQFFETPNEIDDEFGNGIPTEFSDDIFFMTEAEVMKAAGSFIHDGELYVVSLHSNLTALTGEYLRMAQEAGGYGADVMLFGWTTKEGASFSDGYELSLSVTNSPVPVPAAVWLMGTGLAGLVAMKRRNRS